MTDDPVVAVPAELELEERLVGPVTFRMAAWLALTAAGAVLAALGPGRIARAAWACDDPARPCRRAVATRRPSRPFLDRAAVVLPPPHQVTPQHDNDNGNSDEPER